MQIISVVTIQSFTRICRLAAGDRNQTLVRIWFEYLLPVIKNINIRRKVCGLYFFSDCTTIHRNIQYISLFYLHKKNRQRQKLNSKLIFIFHFFLHKFFTLKLTYLLVIQILILNYVLLA